ncbi:hypothetical protein ACFLXO_00275 [Chloroflexota bacterium]
MSAGDIVSNIFMNLLFATPYLAAWITAIVLSVIMLRRGGGRAEKFLLAGSCMMLAEKMLTVPLSAVINLQIIPSLLEKGESYQNIAVINTYTRLFFGLVSLAGIVCLVYAFWIKFKVRANAHSQP